MTLSDGVRQMKFVSQWTGSTFLQLNQGLDNSVQCSVMDANNEFVYFGGFFKKPVQSQFLELNGVAKWDGHNWIALGNGLPQFISVDAMTLSPINNFLYVGGTFEQAGNFSCSNLAVWNGIEWNCVGNGVNSTVLALQFDIFGKILFIGGGFGGSMDGLYSPLVIQWNGTDFLPLLLGFDSPQNPPSAVLAITVNQKTGDVYLAGRFSGNLPDTNETINNIIMWNNTHWNSLGSGLNFVSSSLAFDPQFQILFVAASYFLFPNEASNVSIFALWKVLSKEWQTPYIGTSPSFSIVPFGNDSLLLGGQFAVSEACTSDFAKYVLSGDVPPSPAPSPSQWSSPGGGIDGVVHAIAVGDANQIFVGGLFPSAGGELVNNIVLWNGETFIPLENGVSTFNTFSPVVNSLVYLNGILYAGGCFTNASGVDANFIAGWNGTNWFDLGLGSQGALSILVGVWAIAATTDGKGLVVGGFFHNAGGVNVSNAAFYNITSKQWSSIGQGFDRRIYAIVVDDENNWYFGGTFTNASGIPCSSVAKWNGTSFSNLGGGVEGQVQALAIWNEMLFVGGQFSSAGSGISVNNIAIYSNEEWSSPASGLGSPNSAVLSLFATKNGVFASGIFTTPSSFVSFWNGEAWSDVGKGTNGKVNVVFFNSKTNQTIVGGNFSLDFSNDKIHFFFFFSTGAFSQTFDICAPSFAILDYPIVTPNDHSSSSTKLTELQIFFISAGVALCVCSLLCAVPIIIYLVRTRQNKNRIPVPITPPPPIPIPIPIPQNFEIDPKDVNINMKPIKSGNTGTVYFGTYKGSKAAFKSVIKLEKINTLLNEGILMSHAKDPLMVLIFGIVFKENVHYIVMEKAPKGSLQDYLNRYRKSGKLQFMKADLIQFSINAAKCVQNLVSNELVLVHRDICPSNFLVFSPSQIKIADFEKLVWLKSQEEKRKENIDIQIQYSAPEVVKERIFSVFSDRYSLGITIWRIMSGMEMPFPTKSETKLEEDIIKGEHVPDSLGFSRLHLGLCRNVIMNLTSSIPEKRNIESAITELTEILKKVNLNTKNTNNNYNVEHNINEQTNDFYDEEISDENSSLLNSRNGKFEEVEFEGDQDDDSNVEDVSNAYTFHREKNK